MTLSEPLSDIFRLTEQQKGALRKLHIENARDLLFHFPARYEQGGDETTVAGLTEGQEASIVGTLEKLETKKSWKRRIPVSEGYVRDHTGRIKVRWFNQPYIAKMWQNGTLVKATGRVSGKSKLYLANPELIRVSTEESGLFGKNEHKGPTFMSDEPSLFAVYPESSGITSLWFRHAIAKILENGAMQNVEDPLPQEIRRRYNLPSLSTALVWIHMPHSSKDALAARKRFAFEEVFFIQIDRQRERQKQLREKSFAIDVPQKIIEKFIDGFPFEPTGSQRSAIETILKDLASGHPMSRLLEGDVGSGKTAVAATAAFAIVSTRPANQNFGTLQVAYMAPTEILAKQHFESFIKYFEPTPKAGEVRSLLNIGLITGAGCYKFPSKIHRGKATKISRAQLLKWVANGEIPILIGTHALIQSNVQFKHLALAVIDEQHRFGTSQRRKLARKDVQIPHLLSMTATPIPRTLALTIYGDLDLTLLNEMPPGRKTIITEILRPEERTKAYKRIREELQAGRQAYIICPRIDEPDPQKAFALQTKSVRAEAKRLKQEVFQEFEIDILHSKMKPAEKDEAMHRFEAHKTDIVVATSVVEVGINVPNATIILIEGAERFGLAQLHQLRGRVVRSNHQAYCFCVTESHGEQTATRLKTLATAKNGFELADFDLMQRGAGQLGGTQQWGISDVGMEALKNLNLVEAARAEALALVEKDETLSNYPSLARAVSARAQTLHFE